MMTSDLSAEAVGAEIVRLARSAKVRQTIVNFILLIV